MRSYFHPAKVISHQHPHAEVYDLYYLNPQSVVQAYQRFKLVESLHFPCKENAYDTTTRVRQPGVHG